MATQEDWTTKLITRVGQLARSSDDKLTWLVERVQTLEQMNTVLAQSVAELTQEVRKLAIATEAAEANKLAPNYRRKLTEYPSFDWASIDAEVVNTDGYGVQAVQWGGYEWTRKSPDNAYGDDVFFSRSIGKDESGKHIRVRLIGFYSPRQQSAPRPISRGAEAALKSVSAS